MIDFKDLVVKVVKEDSNVGTYEISPLPRGYGHTLANSLRRILLSSLEGFSPISVKIAGVEHEYTTIDGIKENVLEIILNVKSLRFSSTNKGLQYCTLDVSGKRIVTAGDLKISGGLEVVDKDAHIATLTSPDAHLNLEIAIENGVGYRPAGEQRTETGMIPLDADFSPIKKVSFEVISARKGQETDLDGVHISVVTDGSVKPLDAILNSARILQEFAGKVMASLGVPVTEVEELAEASRVVEVQSDESVSSVSDEVLAWRVEDLPISKRSKTGLINGGYKTLGDLTEITTTDLLNLSGFGNKSLSEVIDLLNQYGIELKSE